MGSAIQDINGKTIKVGDCVATRNRQEGSVEKIVTDKEEIENEGFLNPPKVLFTDQVGSLVAHNPGSLEIA